MSKSLEKTKGWLGVILVLWPVIRIVAGLAGVPLPDLGMGDVLLNTTQATSQGLGAYLLAKSEKI